MARVTVEDCVTILPNRFELVLLAAQRSRQLSAGASMTVEKKNDKNPVISLREIAEETISADSLRENLIRSMQKSGFKSGSDSDLETEFLEALNTTIDMSGDEEEGEENDVTECSMKAEDVESMLTIVEGE